MQSAESNRQSNVDQTNLDLNNRFHLSSSDNTRRQEILNHNSSNGLHNHSINQTNLNNNLNEYSNNNSINNSLNSSNFNSLYSSTTDQLRHRSLDYNCITTNFNNGSISSSFINQANSFNNKFTYSHQPLVSHSMQTNVLKNTNINSLQSPYYLANTNNTNHHLSNHSSSVQPGTNHNTLAKGAQPAVSMVGKGPQTLLLTTKDGQQTTMVVQQPNSVSVSDCNVTTAVLAPNSTSLNSSTPQVITINKPLTQNSTLTSHQQPQQILVSNTQGVLPANMVLNMNASRPTYAAVNNQTPQRAGIGQRVVLNNLNSQIRLGPTQMIAQRAPGTPNTATVLTAPNLSNLRGAIIFKTENGIQFLNVGNSSSPTVLPQTYRFSVPTSTATISTAGIPNNASNIRPMNQQIVTLPASLASNIQRTAVITQQQPNQTQRLTATQQINQPLTIQTTQANNQTNAAPSQMSPDTAKKKCKNFLSTLIRLASDQPEQVATNVRNLIQGLIDGNIQPEEFTVQLQRELNSSPQPCLVPFLKKSLPYLRYSLMMKELTIDGVRPPAVGSCTLPVQLQFQQRAPTGQVRIVTTNQNALINKTTTAKTIQKVQKQSTITVASTTSLNSTIKSNLSSSKKKDNISKSKTPASSKDRREKKSKEDKESFLSSLRDDDDINDVAAMGGVNLMEEHQRILANEEFVGAQIRSCKDEPFLFVNSLQERLNKISLNHGLDEVPMDVVALVSHAAQERLKTFVEKLGIIAEHRIENLKMDNRYEITQDVRSQIKFLDELDKLEKKRHLEQEREILMKAAKSRSKAEDPEQLKLKQKAKEMQRAEMEETRQREANETALLAIGPRKKLKTSHNPINSSTNFSFNSSSNSVSLSLLNFTNSSKQRRVKRVNLRDLQFLMEQEKQTVRSSLLYRTYAK